MSKNAVISGAAFAVLVTVLNAPPASARVLDLTQKMCGQATVTAKLEQDGRDREVDIEVYSQSRGETWRVTIRDADGKLLHRVSRTTNRDSEFDFWRYVPRNSKQIGMSISGPSNQSCTLQLSAN